MIKATAVVYPSRAGLGGLGLQAATAIASLDLAGPVVAFGPGQTADWPLDCPRPSRVTWIDSPPFAYSWLDRKIVSRLRPGRVVFKHNRWLGQWARHQLDLLRPAPESVYAFVQVGFEALEWAKARGIPTILDNPNGHIRGFAQVYRDESKKWLGTTYHGHPTRAMVERVEREYELADRIRVSSSWAKASMVAYGVPADKIFICRQPVNRVRFTPPANRLPAEGPLRVVYVGSLDLRKGFVYMFRAGRTVGAERISFELVGGTVDRGSKRVAARGRAGLNVRFNPGDPVAAYQRAEIFVLPSLEDGFGFVVAEAMACGLPVVVTDQCGAAEWVKPGATGWVIPAGDADALARVFEDAITRRTELPAMGQAARQAIEAQDSRQPFQLLANFLRKVP